MRWFTVLAGTVVAALGGALVHSIIALLSDGALVHSIIAQLSGATLADLLGMFLLLLMFHWLAPLPVAALVIAITEGRAYSGVGGKRNWPFFLIAGLFCGYIFSSFFLDALISIAGFTASAMIFWWIAWVRYPPACLDYGAAKTDRDTR